MLCGASQLHCICYGLTLVHAACQTHAKESLGQHLPSVVTLQAQAHKSALAMNQVALDQAQGMLDAASQRAAGLEAELVALRSELKRAASADQAGQERVEKLQAALSQLERQLAERQAAVQALDSALGDKKLEGSAREAALHGKVIRR